MKTNLQQRLQMAMDNKRINAAELSRLSGVGKVHISNYLNGKYEGKQDKIYLLARALGVDPGWLMTGDMPANLELSVHERSIILAYRKSDSSTKAAVCAVLHVETEPETKKDHASSAG